MARTVIANRMQIDQRGQQPGIPSDAPRKPAIDNRWYDEVQSPGQIAQGETLSMGPNEEPVSSAFNRPPADQVAIARNYLKSVVSAGKGNTMNRRDQSIDLAISRLHPTFATNLANTIQTARANGINAGVFSSYRPYGMGTSGYGPGKDSDSIHTYGMGVDISGIGGPGSKTAKQFQQIAQSHGVYNPYGYKNGLEFNHYQYMPVKFGNTLRGQNPAAYESLLATVTADGPKDLDAMWAAGDAVAAYPQALAALGGEEGVRQYQANHPGLAVDGKVGPNTARVLMAELVAGVPPSSPSTYANLEAPEGGTQVQDAPSAMSAYTPNLPDADFDTPAQAAIDQNMQAAPPAAPTGQTSANHQLAGIMLAEGRGEGQDGMAAIGNVVLNRAASEGNRFPDAVDAVINQANKNGKREFSALPMTLADVKSGRITQQQWDDAVNLETQLLNGEVPDNTGGATYFANVAQSKVGGYAQILKSGPVSATIGDHTFHTDRRIGPVVRGEVQQVANQPDTAPQPPAAQFPGAEPAGVPTPRERPSNFEWMGGGAPAADAVAVPPPNPNRAPGPAVGGPNDRRPQPPLPQGRPATFDWLGGGAPAADAAGLTPPMRPAEPFLGGVRPGLPGSMPTAPPPFLGGVRPGLPGSMPGAPPLNLMEPEPPVLSPERFPGFSPSRKLADELNVNRRTMEGYTTPVISDPALPPSPPPIDRTFALDAWGDRYQGMADKARGDAFFAPNTPPIGNINYPDMPLGDMRNLPGRFDDAFAPPASFQSPVMGRPETPGRLPAASGPFFSNADPGPTFTPPRVTPPSMPSVSLPGGARPGFPGSMPAASGPYFDNAGPPVFSGRGVVDDLRGSSMAPPVGQFENAGIPSPMSAPPVSTQRDVPGFDMSKFNAAGPQTVNMPPTPYNPFQGEYSGLSMDDRLIAESKTWPGHVTGVMPVAGELAGRSPPVTASAIPTVQPPIDVPPKVVASPTVADIPKVVAAVDPQSGRPREDHSLAWRMAGILPPVAIGRALGIGGARGVFGGGGFLGLRNAFNGGAGAGGGGGGGLMGLFKGGGAPAFTGLGSIGKGAPMGDKGGTFSYQSGYVGGTGKPGVSGQTSAGGMNATRYVTSTGQTITVATDPFTGQSITGYG